MSDPLKPACIDWYKLAQDRANQDPDLSFFVNTIMREGCFEGPDFWRWVVISPVEEILEWAYEIEAGEAQSEAGGATGSDPEATADDR